MQKAQELVTLPIGDIRLRDRIVKPSPQDVSKMVKSIEQIGVIQPPVVNKNNVLIAGFTRYLALVKLGHEKVECLKTIGLSNKAAERLMEIDENLSRRIFSPAQMARQIKARREAWEEINGKVKRGRPKKGEGPGFAAETAEQTGLSLSTIRRVTKISQTIGKTALDALDEVPIGSHQKSLLRIATIEDNELRARTIKYAIKSKAKDWAGLSSYIRKELKSATPVARARWEHVVGEILMSPAEAQEVALETGDEMPAHDGDVYDGSAESGERAAAYTALKVIQELGSEVLAHVEGVTVVDWDSIKSTIDEAHRVQRRARMPIDSQGGEEAETPAVM